METLNSYNLMDVDNLVDSFIKEKIKGITALHRMYYHTDNQLAFKAFCSSLSDELRSGCVTFINKNSSLDDLNSYLFYIVNSFCKKNSSFSNKKKIEYLCPGCLFLGEKNLISLDKTFVCEECDAEYKKTKDPKKVLFFNTFRHHNKIGYRCQDCNRFIPHPLDNSKFISCPYFDCCFVGDFHLLKKMNHPTSQINPESLILDCPKGSSLSLKDLVSSKEISALSKLEIEEGIRFKIKTIKDVIEQQSNSVSYSSSDFTVKHKLFVYQAFSNLLDRMPEEMIGYLLNNSRSGGFQHRVFQEYISILENSLPIIFKKSGKVYRIDSLLDSNLCLFDGISVFDAVVDDKGGIKNNTQEFYIGGRKASITKNYYIGKLLGIINKQDKCSLMNNVVGYSFSKIKMKDVLPGTEVSVTHLRVPPHYQMGGMVYVNRIRKKIVDRARNMVNDE